MQQVEVLVPIADVQVGDKLIGVVDRNGNRIVWVPGYNYTVVPGWLPAGRNRVGGLEWWRSSYKGYSGFLAMRDPILTQPVRNAVARLDCPATAAKKVKDWPLDCPRCRRRESAYLGLNQYDCKHGCYK